MGSSALVKLFGFRAMLLHGDSLVSDRWRWLKSRLPETRNGEKLIDIGCGNGAFAIGSAQRGYKSLGLSWSQNDCELANYRATLCGADNVDFEVFDVRNLDLREDFICRFDVALCFENIEHIIDDQKQFSAIFQLLKPGGRLLLSSPNFYYKAMSPEDNGPFHEVEDGGHVRRGYTRAMLHELCTNAGFECEEISSCSGYFSQVLTALHRSISRVSPMAAWLFVLPLRVFPPIFDNIVSRFFCWPNYSICLVAYKPRFLKSVTSL